MTDAAVPVLPDAADLPPGWHVEINVPLATLKEHPDNPRRGDLAKIEESIRAHGFVDVVVAQTSTRHIISGNHRTRVAKKLGHKNAPLVIWADVDDPTAKRLMLAYNRATDEGGYDRNVLLDVLRDLDATTDGLEGTLYQRDDIAELHRLTGGLGADAAAFLADLAVANGTDGEQPAGAVARTFHLTFPFDQTQRDSALVVIARAKDYYETDNSAVAILRVLDDWNNRHPDDQEH